MSAPRSITFTVYGRAVPQGSKKPFMIKPKDGREPFPVLVDDNPRVKPWRELIAHAAQRAANGTFFEGPVVLTATFYLERPKYLKDRNEHHTKAPDVLKLTRAVEDALTKVIYRDDACIVDEHIFKRYAPPGAAPCVQVTVTEACAEQLAPMPMPLFREEVGA